MKTETPAPPGVNGSLLFSGILGASAAALWPEAGDDWRRYLLAWMLAGGGAASGVGGLNAWAKDIRTRRLILKSEETSTDHGSAREATIDEIRARGCCDPDAGLFIGFKDGVAIFAPRDAPFVLTESPPGTGKGIDSVLGEIMHFALRGYSVCAPDVKCELAPMLAEGLRRAGVELWCVNPTGKHLELCGNIELGLYDSLIKAVHSVGEARKSAVGIADQIAKLHLPDRDVDKGKIYFVGGSRRLKKFIALEKALIDPANCTPTAVLSLLNDVEALVATLKTVITQLAPLSEDDCIVDELKSEARNLLHRHQTNPENFGSFIEWATQSLAPYNRAGHLANYGAKSTHDIEALTERPITLMPMTPLSHAGEFESFTSILNANLLSACKRNPNRQRIHLVCDEMLNYRFADIASDLETMRGLGVTASFYIQSFNGLIRQYGRETAASVNDYCDVKIYAGLNSYERAKYVSDMLSETTINSRDYSFKARPDEVSISSRRHARRLRTTDEILAAPRDEAWVFVKRLRPFRVKRAHYGHVDPWKDMVGRNPLEGPPLKGKTLLKINYPKKEMACQTDAE